MMSAVFSLATLALASAAPQLPAGLTAAACPNYPYCDATTGFLEIPDVPGASPGASRAEPGAPRAEPAPGPAPGIPG